MTNIPPGGNTSSDTIAFTDSEDVSFASVVPSIISRSEHIALYFADDLEEFLRLTNIDLADELHIPLDYSQDPRDIIAMLYDDLSHMLRDELITGIHLLLSDRTPDPNKGGAYPVKYHVQYTINASNATSTLPSSGSSPKPFGGLIAPPRDVLKDSRFALLIDWNNSAKSKRYRVRRPEYNFDWVPESAKFDATTVVSYREGGLMNEGGLTVASAQVTRVERH